MRMDVRDHGELARAAHRPELGKGVRAKDAYAARIGGRVEIVIIDDIDCGAAAAVVMSEQERAGFVPALRAPVQLGHGACPK